MKIIDESIENYALNHTTEESPLLKEIREVTDRELEYSNMLTNRMVGRLLQTLIKLGGLHRVLEVGMFTGYSALTMAEALPENGEVVTLEMNERYEKIARDFVERSPDGRKISIVMGMAEDTLTDLDHNFDLAFIDADKRNYPLYYDLIKPRLSPGGIIVVDNAFWSGSVLNPNEDEKGKAVDELNKKIRDDSDVEHVLLTVRDGLHLVRKLA
jgi:caffeoyl-CoA O-methyltransferase